MKNIIKIYTNNFRYDESVLDSFADNIRSNLWYFLLFEDRLFINMINQAVQIISWSFINDNKEFKHKYYNFYI